MEDVAKAAAAMDEEFKKVIYELEQFSYKPDMTVTITNHTQDRARGPTARTGLKMIRWVTGKKAKPVGKSQ